MGSNIHLKNKAISLRREGRSYNDIRKTLGIMSKGTLSGWFKNLELSEVSRNLLQQNNKLAYTRGLLGANKKRKALIDDENRIAQEFGYSSIYALSKNELLIIGAALYWAEGTKSEKGASRSLAFSNSDPKMIRVYMKFIREVLKVQEEKIRAGIHIYNTNSENLARKFWSDITDLPQDRFYIVTQISRASQNRRPFNSLPHGTVSIRINSRIEFFKVKGMIQGLFDKLIK